MKHTFFRAVAVAASLACPSIHAQQVSSFREAARETAIDIEETVFTGEALYTNQVNALRTPTPIIDVPQSLSLTSAEEILLRDFDSIGDIVAYTPGVNMSQGEGHRDAVVFRGVRSTADFFVDGVRDDVQYYRPLYNVEQVEILRGPNALLFGRGGTGGLLNRVSKKAQFDDDFTGFVLSVDTFGGTDVQLDTNIAINESAAFRFNAFYEQPIKLLAPCTCDDTVFLIDYTTFSYRELQQKVKALRTDKSIKLTAKKQQLIDWLQNNA